MRVTYSTSLCSSEKLSCTLVSQTQSVPIGVRGAFEFPSSGAKSGTPESVLRGQLTKTGIHSLGKLTCVEAGTHCGRGKVVLEPPVFLAV